MTTIDEARLRALVDKLTTFPESVPSTAHVQFIREYVPALLTELAKLRKVARAAQSFANKCIMDNIISPGDDCREYDDLIDSLMKSKEPK